MRKAPLTCPVCHKQLDLIADNYECVQVKEGCCRVMDVRSLRSDTEGTICFVHPNHVEDLVMMVRTGTYLRTQDCG